MDIISIEEFKALHNSQNEILVFGMSGTGNPTAMRRFMEQQTKKETPYEYGKHAIKKGVI